MEIVSLIGGLITLALVILKMSNDKARAKKERQDAIDKKIDSASDADDIMRASGELRD